MSGLRGFRLDNISVCMEQREKWAKCYENAFNTLIPSRKMILEDIYKAAFPRRLPRKAKSAAINEIAAMSTRRKNVRRRGRGEGAENHQFDRGLSRRRKAENVKKGLSAKVKKSSLPAYVHTPSTSASDGSDDITEASECETETERGSPGPSSPSARLLNIEEPAERPNPLQIPQGGLPGNSNNFESLFSGNIPSWLVEKDVGKFLDVVKNCWVSDLNKQNTQMQADKLKVFMTMHDQAIELEKIKLDLLERILSMSRFLGIGMIL